MHEIYHQFNIKTDDTLKIYRALTEQAGLAGWWTTATTAVPQVGSVATFRFSPDYHKEMKVTNLEEGKLVEWECIRGDEQWLGTTVRFELIPGEDSTDVRFYHGNWKEKSDLFGICNYHWGLYMKSLKSLIEDGKGNPTDPQL